MTRGLRWIWPHISDVAEARNAVAACRYPAPATSGSGRPSGVRGFGPSYAARYWGLGIEDYCAKADAWPLAADGELAVIIMCEEQQAVRRLPRILADVPGIAAVLIGTADLSMDLGLLGRPHPAVEAEIARALEACIEAGIACGIPGVLPGDANAALTRASG